MTSQQPTDVYAAPDLQSFIANLPQEIIDEVPPSAVATQTPVTFDPPVVQSEPKEEKAKTFHCGECNRTLTRKRYLSTHRFRHLPYEARPYGCSECPKKYVTKWSLERHTKTKHATADKTNA